MSMFTSLDVCECVRDVGRENQDHRIADMAYEHTPCIRSRMSRPIASSV